jgi:hypothetical protein
MFDNRVLKKIFGHKEGWSDGRLRNFVIWNFIIYILRKV